MNAEEAASRKTTQRGRERREVLRELELAMRAPRLGARSSNLRELLSGISINGCLHCADGSYDDVLNGPRSVYVDVDVGEVARIKRGLVSPRRDFPRLPLGMESEFTLFRHCRTTGLCVRRYTSMGRH